MLTQDRLKQLITYNPSTGEFTWRINKPPRGFAGEPCGKMNDASLRIMIDGRNYAAARIAWLYVTGNMPERIKFVDGDITNFRFKNLEIKHAR